MRDTRDIIEGTNIAIALYDEAPPPPMNGLRINFDDGKYLIIEKKNGRFTFFNNAVSDFALTLSPTAFSKIVEALRELEGVK